MASSSKSCVCSLISIFLMFGAVISIFKFAAWKLEKRQNAFRSLDRGGLANEEEDLPYAERKSNIRIRLQGYAELHDAARVLRDPSICQRKFVLVQYPTQGDIGQSTFEFLNGFAAAVILNRTLVAARPSSGKRVPWRSKWIADIQEIRAAWKGQGCAGGNELTATPTDGKNLAGILRCCGNSSTIDPMISQCMGHHLLYQLREAVHGKTDLGPSLSTVRDMFSVDEYTAYGLLLRAALTIPPTGPRVIAALGHIESYHTSKNLVVIGIHLRHYASEGSAIQGELSAAIQSLKKIVDAHVTPSIPCAILMASNRPELFDFADSNGGVLFGCKVTRVEKLKKDETTLGVTETGLWPESSVLLDDISLLSIADIFVGSKLPSSDPSAVSLLIADLLASDHKEGSRNIYWIGNVVITEDFQAHSFQTRTWTPTNLMSSVVCFDHKYCSVVAADRSVSCPRLQPYESRPPVKSPVTDKLVLVPGKQRPDGRPVYYNPKYDLRNRTKKRTPPDEKSK